MSITPGANVRLFHVLEWHPAKKLYTVDLTWTAWLNTFYVNAANGWTHGDPVNVEAGGVGYVEVYTAADCEASQGTWFWDTPTSTLYVHCHSHVNPNTLISLAYLQEFYSSHSPIILNGKYAEPRLKPGSIPSISLGTSSYHLGGTQQSFGVVKLVNNDAYFDSRLSTYIYEGKLIKLFEGHFTEGPGGEIIQVSTVYPTDLAQLWTGWSGNIKWSDGEIEITPEDLRKMMVKNAE